MKQVKLFLSLLLLFVGVSSLSAKTEYRVLYEKEILSGTGYTVTGSGVESGPDEHILVLTADNVTLTSSTVANYITARPKDGYNVSFYVNTAEAELGYAGNIYINYQTTATEQTWNDGTFLYSNIYQRETYTRVLMPEGEVALSLYMGDTETVVDTVAYTQSNNRIYNGNGDRLYTDRQTTTSDDDGDEIGERATYTYIGNHTSGFGGGTYFFERSHQVACSKETSVTIPATVPAIAQNDDGETNPFSGYKVTAIQKWGFGYKQTHQMMISSGTHNNCTANYFWGCIDDHSNRYLQQVRFENPSNIKSIGDYAFMSSTALTSIVFPNSLEYLGQGIFEMCYKLNDVRFQTRADGTVGFEMIKMFTFWLCTGLKSLELPNGITEIEGQQAGAAMQYMLQLTNIKLPNTLKKIGPHFLCCASSLETVTIPASVEYIDGASFHGCESLKTVYLLGPASALQKEYTGSGSTQSSSTFDANSTFCKEQVSNCTFYTTPDYVESYASDVVWSLIADNRDGGYLVDENGNYITDSNGNRIRPASTGNGDDNKLYVIPEEKRTFTAGKWVTAIFPNEISHTFPGDASATIGLNNVFSAPATADTPAKAVRVAKMTGATTETGVDPKSGKSIIVYNLTFTLIDNANFETGVPYMFCPGRTVENYVMITLANLTDEDFRLDMTNTHEYSVYSDKNDGQVYMKGQYAPYTMHPWDFYFSYSESAEGEPAKFFRVPDAANAATAGPTRCYWSINVEGVKSDGEMAPSKQNNIFDYIPNGIDEVETRVVIKGIYDLNGRKLDINPADLPQGMFIVNGKKVLVK